MFFIARNRVSYLASRNRFFSFILGDKITCYLSARNKIFYLAARNRN